MKATYESLSPHRQRIASVAGSVAVHCADMVGRDGSPFTMRLGDLLNMVDAEFDGHHKMPGWVHMFANAKGCNHVDALFPQACIEWRETPLPSLPIDWHGMQVNLPEAVSSTTTILLLEVISAGRTTDDCSPDQLALLLAFGVRRDGGRAAILSQQNGTVSVELFIPREN